MYSTYNDLIVSTLIQFQIKYINKIKTYLRLTNWFMYGGGFEVGVAISPWEFRLKVSLI